MIEITRALVERIDAEIVEHETHIGRLTALRASVTAFIEQPEQGSGAPEGAPAPVSKPPSRQGPPGASSTAAHEADDPAEPEPEKNRPRRADPPVVSSPAASSTHSCAEPGCDRSFGTASALGIHRAKTHGIPGASAEKHVKAKIAAAKAANGKPTHPSRREKFLCGRNCGASFGSLDDVRAHEGPETCTPVQTRPPTDREPFVINPDKPQATRASGFGQ